MENINVNNKLHKRECDVEDLICLNQLKQIKHKFNARKTFQGFMQPN